MILGVTNINEVLVLTEDMAQALWMVELHFVIVAIYKSHLAISNLTLKLHSFFVNDQHPVIARI